MTLQTKLIKGKWTGPRVYRMTIASCWYNAETREVECYEMHYKVPRKGDIRTVRRHLAKRGLKHFQRNVYRVTGKWPTKKKVRTSFERETSTKGRGKNVINIEVRRMIRVAKRWTAQTLPRKLLNYIVKRRKRRTK